MEKHEIQCRVFPNNLVIVADLIESLICDMPFTNDLHQTMRKAYYDAPKKGIDIYANHSDDRVKMAANDLHALQKVMDYLMSEEDEIGKYESMYGIVADICEQYRFEWTQRHLSLLIEKCEYSLPIEKFRGVYDPLIAQYKGHIDKLNKYNLLM